MARRKKCDQCNAVRITYGGITRVCHEHGCPNAPKRQKPRRVKSTG